MAAQAPRPAPQARRVPRAVRVLLGLSLAAQLGWQASQRPAAPQPQDLPPPPALSSLQLASLNEAPAAARLSMLYLQSFDDQPGVRLAWRQLDYGRVLAWLQRALELDPRSQYPLLAASEVYGAVNDPVRVRLMLDWVYARFAEDPNRRWPWLAHAAVVAKHRLHDLPLARRYAQALRLQATAPDVPPWARELEAFILEDMNEAEAARVLIGGLLQGGQITDPHELAFLQQRLEALAAPAPAAGR